jgi:hypothetical protein
MGGGLAFFRSLPSSHFLPGSVPGFFFFRGRSVMDFFIREEVDMAEKYGLSIVRVSYDAVNKQVAEMLAYLEAGFHGGVRLG